MPRQPRLLSETGVYHIMLRGVNHCQLFEETADYEYFLARLTTAKTELSLQVFAYCLMPNHVHLLVKEESPGDVTAAMRKSLTPYAWWVNRKYTRSGPLMANRYKSECVTDDPYLLAVTHYIHRNPVAAGIAQHMDSYPWSSYRSYTTGVPTLTDTDFILSLFSPDRATAIARFIEFHQDASTAASLNVFPDDRPDERQIGNELSTHYDGLKPSAIPGLPRTQRDAVIAHLRDQGFSVRQIERVTGVSRGIVARIRAVPREEA